MKKLFSDLKKKIKRKAKRQKHSERGRLIYK
jgi:hypothetical protein